MKETDPLFEALARALREGRDPDDLEAELWKRFGETCAVMVVDSTGFSRVTQARGIVFFLAVIARLREIGLEVFRQHDALCWRLEADNLYADFASADSALEAAFALHRRLAQEGIMLNEKDRFGACVGIGYGRMLRSDREGMYGDEMNLASKLGEDTAGGGETLLTEAAFQALSDHERLFVSEKQETISGVDLPYYSVRPR